MKKLKKFLNKIFNREVEETFIWIGDGFSSGSDQVGRDYDVEGLKGKVVSGDGLTITVRGRYVK